MKKYAELSHQELVREKGVLLEKLNEYKSEGLNLNMSRGNPGADQLAMSEGLLTCVATSADCISRGTDTRNYGPPTMLEGLPEMRDIFGAILGVDAARVIVGGNSSLSMMYDAFSRAMLHGVLPGMTPWMRQDKIKFLCPSPGYDRHFTICERFGIEMITVPMTACGPDMDAVEELVKDPAVKGMWCTPKYSNPTGIVYSDETVLRLAALNPAAPDFRIFWDNAYAVHVFRGDDRLMNIMEALERNGKEDMIYMFASSSKISFAGSGVAAFAASAANIAECRRWLFAQTIGPDKVNQLRHTKFYGDIKGVESHMKRHAELVRPKFDAVMAAFDSGLAGLGIADWSNPSGGYFISLNVMDGCAKRVNDLMKDAGVVLTPAGATFPYGKDPRDANLRIAPTFPPLGELKMASEILCVCVRLAACERLLDARA